MTDHFVRHVVRNGDHVKTEYQCRASEDAQCRQACARCWNDHEEVCICESRNREPDIRDVGCTIIPWLTEDAPEECYGGEDQPVRGPDWQPIDATWNGDNYEWDYAAANPTGSVFESVGDHERGLYPKYRVEKLNGKPVGEFFALEATDPHAVAAVRAYANSCAGEFNPLAVDLWAMSDRWAKAHLDLKVCKHCPEFIAITPQSADYVHVSGVQAGKHTCAVDPYGFHAEPLGSPCSNNPANPCNGARGLTPRAGQKMTDRPLIGTEE